MSVFLSNVWSSYDQMGISLRHSVKHGVYSLAGFSEHNQTRTFRSSVCETGNVTKFLGADELPMSMKHNSRTTIATNIPCFHTHKGRLNNL